MKKFQKILVLGIAMLFVGTSIVLPAISMKQFSPDIQLWEPTSRNGNDHCIKIVPCNEYG